MHQLLAALPERYQVRQTLGRGGMGVVVAAWDQELEREVALKVLHLAPEAEVRERFRREVRVLARLRCAQVVEVYDFDADGAHPWLAMEWVRGKDLRCAPPEDPGATYLAVAEGLAAVHRAGLVHRDVKPSNILRSEDGRVILLDFGLATGESEARLTHTGCLVGTPEYMAPELLLGGRPSPASDWYAWGVSLYEAVEGRPPFVGSSIAQALEGGRPPVEFRRLAAASPLAQLLRRCLAPDPARRTSGLREVRAVLEAEDRTRPGPSEGPEARRTEALSPAMALDAGDATGRGAVVGEAPGTRYLRAWWGLALALAVSLVAVLGLPRAPRPRSATPAAPEARGAPVLPLAAELAAALESGELAPRYEASGVGAYRNLPAHRRLLEATEAGEDHPLDHESLRAADAAARAHGWVEPFGPGWSMPARPGPWGRAFVEATEEASRAHQLLETRAHQDPASIPGVQGASQPLLNPEARVLVAFRQARRTAGGTGPLDAFLRPGRWAWRRLAAVGLRELDAASEQARPVLLQGLLDDLHRTRTLVYGSLCGATAVQVLGKAPTSHSGRYLALEVEEVLAALASDAGILSARDELERSRAFRSLAEDRAAPEELRRRAWLRALWVARGGGLAAEVRGADEALRGLLEVGLSPGAAEALARLRAWAARGEGPGGASRPRR